MTNPQDMDTRLIRVEVDIAELKQFVAETSRQIFDLRSPIATFADIVASHEALHQESRPTTNLGSALSSLLSDLIEIEP